MDVQAQRRPILTGTEGSGSHSVVPPKDGVIRPAACCTDISLLKTTSKSSRYAQLKKQGRRTLFCTDLTWNCWIVSFRGEIDPIQRSFSASSRNSSGTDR